jgi:hypothetical protein
MHIQTICRITAPQKESLIQAFQKCDGHVVGNFLWLRVAVQNASHWRSFDLPPTLEPSFLGLISQLYAKLEKHHGMHLVSAVLGWLGITKRGVSHTELQGLLSLQNDVLADVYQWWVPPLRVIPPLLLSRLLHELNIYILRRGDFSGQVLVSFYHRQFLETAQARYLSEDKQTHPVTAQAIPRSQRHAQMAEYYGGDWSNKFKPYSDSLKAAVQKVFPDECEGNRLVPSQRLVLSGRIFGSRPVSLNLRRIQELVFHRIRGKEKGKAITELCSLEYFFAKFEIQQSVDLQQELTDALSLGSSDHVADYQQFLSLHRSVMERWVGYVSST